MDFRFCNFQLYCMSIILCVEWITKTLIRLRGLICVFVVRIWEKQVLSWCGSDGPDGMSIVRVVLVIILMQYRESNLYRWSWCRTFRSVSNIYPVYNYITAFSVPRNDLIYITACYLYGWSWWLSWCRIESLVYIGGPDVEPIGQYRIYTQFTTISLHFSVPQNGLIHDAFRRRTWNNEIVFSFQHK